MTAVQSSFTDRLRLNTSYKQRCFPYVIYLYGPSQTAGHPFLHSTTFSLSSIIWLKIKSHHENSPGISHKSIIPTFTLVR